MREGRGAQRSSGAAALSRDEADQDIERGRRHLESLLQSDCEQSDRCVGAFVGAAEANPDLQTGRGKAARLACRGLLSIGLLQTSFWYRNERRECVERGM
jgi:hypothetical protein